MKCKGVLKLFFIKFLKKKQDFNLNYKLHVWKNSTCEKIKVILGDEFWAQK
jgi:hypothetical protein